jgi:hypothetical protein
MYILFCAHISFKINISLIQATRPPPEDQKHPRGGAQFENLWCKLFPCIRLWEALPVVLFQCLLPLTSVGKKSKIKYDI